MFESMYAAQGVGLAAPQIGIGMRVTVIDVSNGKNPEAKIVLRESRKSFTPKASSAKRRAASRCRDFAGYVARPQYVTVRAQDATGKEFEMRGEGLLARAFCHEIDHLNGILFITHLSMLKRDLIKRKIRKMKKAGEW